MAISYEFVQKRTIYKVTYGSEHEGPPLNLSISGA